MKPLEATRENFREEGVARKVGAGPKAAFVAEFGLAERPISAKAV
jgi:hypothetical protein